MTTVIEFNDLEFSLYRGGERLYREPGFAIVRDGALLFGEPALRLARMHPQQANQQYFTRMNADPLPQPIRAAANHADLVYLHLKELAEYSHDDAVVAVPGTMNGEQLGVLLGICHEAGIEVSGFVISAVAGLATTPTAEQITHLDVFLQHMQVSELAVNSEVSHERAFEVKDCGFSGLLEGWVNLIADRFVQETRFDPLHTADSEQQLYNQVYDWALGAHHHGEVSVEISTGEQRRRVEIPRSQLEQKAEQRIDRLIDALPARTSIVLTARAARLPGLANRLKTAGFELTLLAADAVPSGCNDHLDRIRTADSELRLINRLPHEHEVAASSVRTGLVPTHLLNDHRARPLSASDLPVRVRLTEDGPWIGAGPGITVNGRSLEADARLTLGDAIVIDGATYTAIRLED
jgi:hypothetical protein